jgi:predicted nucleic acid-binding protein
VITVLDASVIIKWLLRDPDSEAQTDKATQLMEQVINGEQPVLQPIHWILEVGAVLARESAATAAGDVAMLSGLELPTTDEPQVLQRGVELAIELKQHFFDTYYHGVALETQHGVLISADERYLRMARAKGRIVSLADWNQVPV